MTATPPRQDDGTSAAEARAITEQFLRDVTHSIIESINRRNWNSAVWDNMSDDFIAQNEDSRWTSGVTLQKHLSNLSHITKIYPDSRADILDLSVLISDADTQAEVTINLETKNAPAGGPHIQHVYIMEWKKGAEGWKCTKYRGIAGMAGPSMFGGTLSQYL
ncbi:hypothetical protein DOTSEDRAFT_57024 [Dothistroma septosporum NZE10]|uniref:SnoaL-like domain-containing protein n=1 Tax=Dothistroma septosporum (strain NZE10 / CBS 128990) TaxID=675120 RepID=M2XZU7_DOTSN|nr:hypothetical protein DOTSEDRAFT_57024 [Dothistroma septosporum NZE10]